MSETKSILEQHTVGPQVIGFDYQFYYFMYLAVGLRTGEKVGFEVKDDVHIDNPDGTSVLIQTKHSIGTNAAGEIENLTTLDLDLWKTLSNWVDFIKADANKNDFIAKYSFVLATNKNVQNNDFVNCHNDFNKDNDIDKIIDKLKEFKKKTTDKVLKRYITNVNLLGKKNLKEFLQKLKIEAGFDQIIQQIKNRILETVKQEKFVEAVYESLHSNLSDSKYFDIKGKKKFEFTQEEFNKRFGKCYQCAFERDSLPPRNIPVLLPENLEDQVFIKQLIDIGDIVSGSEDIRDYTTQMLKFLNDFTYWDDYDFLIPATIKSFNEDSITIWKNEFKSKYRPILNKIDAGISIKDLEEDSKHLGWDLIDYIRRQNLTIPGYLPLGIPSSNGHYYALSNKLEIGWHYDWKNKYKKE